MSDTPTRDRRPVTVPSLLQRKREQTPIVMVTAYDATFARLVDEAGVDIVLVGDSLGMVMQGHANTLPVTLDESIYHTRCVRRAVRWAHIVCDLPFMSFHLSPEQALASAGRAVKEAGAEAVKLEGGASVIDAVRRIVGAGIPVMGHLGLLPQHVHAMGGFRVQARDESAAERLLAEAHDLQEAGAYSLVLEGIPADLAARVTASLNIPTIGIGAGAACDGQVLVMHDLLGLEDRFKPKFVKRFANLAEDVRSAVGAYATEVRARTFPSVEHTFSSAPRPAEAPPETAPVGAGYGPRE